MIYIESHDRFDDVAFFDPETGRLEEFGRAANPLVAGGPVKGHYARLSATVVVLYRLGASLWLRLGTEARNIDDGSAEAKWSHVSGRSTLMLFDSGEPIAEVEYQPRHVLPAELQNDPTPLADAEDWDFGLFVAKVLGDDGRRARIYGGPS